MDIVILTIAVIALIVWVVAGIIGWAYTIKICGFELCDILVLPVMMFGGLIMLFMAFYMIAQVKQESRNS